MMLGIPAALLSSMERAPWGWALLVVVILALIKVWPIVAAQAVKAREQFRSERRGEMDSLRDRISGLETKVEAANEKAHEVELKLVSALAAYRLIASELQKLDPDSTILKQAQELLNVSYPTPRAKATPADSIRQPESKAGRNAH
jgi:hypothetical protein